MHWHCLLQGITKILTHFKETLKKTTFEEGADSDLRGVGRLRSWGHSSSACPHSRPICFVKSNQATSLQFVYFLGLTPQGDILIKHMKQYVEGRDLLTEITLRIVSSEKSKLWNKVYDDPDFTKYVRVCICVNTCVWADTYLPNYTCFWTMGLGVISIIS